VKRKPSRDAAAPDTAGEITVMPGLGFRGFLTEDDRVQITQGDDNVVLSKTEFKVFTAQFAEWADSPASE
jgi:hypothetical protein